ncbi:MAG: M28 family peptidase, partial [Candidatus Heimdallarchaeaceae archaeon]
MVIYLHDLAEKHGFDLPAKQIHFGNTDAGSFSKKNISATTIFAFGKNDVFDLWHSTEDVVENLDEQLLQQAFELSIKILEELDK